MTTACPQAPTLPRECDPCSVFACVDGRCGKNLGLGWMYKLAAGPRASQTVYGLDVPFTEPLQVDESKMSAVIPFCDGNRRDGGGDLLEVGGVRTERHRLNPIWLFDHGQQVKLPIGMACERDEKGNYDYSKYTVQLDQVNQRGTGNVFFYQGKGLDQAGNATADYDHAVFCQQLFHMTAKRLLGAGSIGYLVVRAKHLQADYDLGVPPGLHLMVTEMTEGSLVVMPMNRDTARKCLEPQWRCEGKPLSPMLAKSLMPYLPERKAQMGYEGKKALPGEGFLNKDQEPQPYGPPPKTGRERQVQATLADSMASEDQNLDSSDGSQVPDASTGQLDWAKLKSLRAKYGKKKAMSATNSASGGALVKPAAVGKTGRKGPAGAAVGEALGTAGGTYVGGPVGGEIGGAAGGAIGSAIEDKIRDKAIKPARQKGVVGGAVGGGAGAAVGGLAGGPVGAVLGGVAGGAIGGSSDDKKDKALPSDKVSPDKARQILKDNEVRDHKLTPKQRGMFGAAAGKKSMNEGAVNEAMHAKRRKEANFTLRNSGKGLPRPMVATIGEAAENEGGPTARLGTLARSAGDTAGGLIGAGKANKAMEDSDGAEWHKGMNELRKKWRKGARHVVRKSAEGSSTMHVQEKDLQAARTEAESKGLGFEHVATSKGLAKVRLTGGDKAMAEVSRVYGRKFQKGLPTEIIIGNRNGHHVFDPNASRGQLQDLLLYAQQEMDKHEAGNARARWAGVIAAVQTALQAGKYKKLTKGVSDMNVKTKDMGGGAGEPADQHPGNSTATAEETPPAEEPTDEQPTEKLGAQVIRAVHEDHLILLEKYDEALGQLENGAVAKKLADKLSAISDELDEWEDLFAKEYKEEGYEPLGDKGMDEGDMVEDDSSEPEEAPAEEAVEGMNTKGEKHLCEHCRKSLPDQLQKPGKPGDTATLGDPAHRPGQEVQNEGAGIGAKAIPPGQPGDDADLGVEDGHEPGSEADREEAASGHEEMGVKGFQPHHKQAISDGSGYLKMVSGTKDWSDEHRMNAWHHGESLLGVHKSFFPEADAATGKVEVTQPSSNSQDVPGKSLPDKTQANAKPGDNATYGVEGGHVPGKEAGSGIKGGFSEVDSADQRANVEEPMQSYLGIVHGAGKYLKALAMERAFGDVHRTKAAYWHKALDPIVGEPEATEVQDPDSNPQDVPGTVGEKSLTDLHRETERQIKALTAGVNGMLARIR